MTAVFAALLAGAIFVLQAILWVAGAAFACFCLYWAVRVVVWLAQERRWLFIGVVIVTTFLGWLAFQTAQ